MVEEKFLIDSNSFMAPYRQYYAFDLIPTYWDELSKRAESGRLVLLDMVKAEIDKGEDDLAAWVNSDWGTYPEIDNYASELTGIDLNILKRNGKDSIYG